MIKKLLFKRRSLVKRKCGNIVGFLSLADGLPLLCHGCLKKFLLTICLLVLIPSLCFATLIGTLTDNFDDNSIDGAKWGTDTGGGGSVAEVNQEIELTSAIAGSDAVLESVSSYDLTGSGLSAKLVDAGNQSLASFNVTPCRVHDSSWAWDYYWIVQGGNIATSNTYSTSYVAATFSYLRIRESGGTIYYDSSTDGITWTNRDSHAKAADITTSTARISIGSTLELSTTTAKVDDFNILPSARRIIFIQ